jgi:hypothetical protein
MFVCGTHSPQRRRPTTGRRYRARPAGVDQPGMSPLTGGCAGAGSPALGWAPDHRPGGGTALECAIPPRPANPPTPSPLWSIRRRAAEFHRRRGGAGLWPGREWGLRKEIPAAGHDAIVRYGLAALAEHAGVAVAPRFGSGTRSRKVRQNRKMTVARMPGAVHDRKAAGAQHSVYLKTRSLRCELAIRVERLVEETSPVSMFIIEIKSFTWPETQCQQGSTSSWMNHS